MSDGLYNENIDLTQEDFYINTETSIYSDDSVQENAIHTWVIDHDTSSGSPGEAMQTAPSPTEAPTVHAITRVVYTRYGIPSYDLSELAQYNNAGCKFYVVYTDGTEAECDYTDVFSPVGIASDIIVNEAASIARATHQFFWNDANGVHITDTPQEDWFDAVIDDFPYLDSTYQYNNILMNSLGILLRSALNNLVSLSRSGVSFYDGTGNDISHILSSFGTAGAIFRESGKTKASVTSQGLTVYDNAGTISNGVETLGSDVAFIGVDVNDNPYSRIGKSSDNYVEITSSDTKFKKSGKTKASVTSQGLTVYDNAGTISNGVETLGSDVAFIGVDVNDNPYSRIGNSDKGYIKIGVNINNNGYIDFYNNNVQMAHIGYDIGKDNNNNDALAPSYTFGTRRSDTDIGNYSFAEGTNTTSSSYCSHAEGVSTTASNYRAHAEGGLTTASGIDSHAEGYYTTASGWRSHAGGDHATANGSTSFSHGYYTNADGSYSCAFGYRTTASSNYLFVCGKWNSLPGSNTSDHLFIVGNGTASDSRKNAFAVLSSGSAYLNGTAGFYGTTVTSDARVKTLINDIDFNTAYKFIKQLKPKHYFKEDVEEYGFYAQDVEEIPEFGDVLVSKDNTGNYDLPDYRLLNYQGMIAPIVSALQGSLERIEQLEVENQQLKKQNEKLNERLERIEKILF